MIAPRNSKAFWLIFVVGLFLLITWDSTLALPTKPMIVYESRRFGENKWDIYTMDLDGRNVRRLTNNPWSNNFPDWSPDGTKIVYRSDSNLAIMDCDGNNIRIIPTPGLSHHQNIDWSPDGSKIVFNAPVGDPFIGMHDIFVLDLTTNAIRNLTNNPREDKEPSWSPDGKWIVFSSNRDQKFWLQDPAAPLGFRPTSDIYIMDSEGNNLKNITQTTSGEFYPVWSPDGNQIAFTLSTGAGGNQLYVMDVKGGNRRRLTNFKGSFAIRSLSWSPDSQQIIFSLQLEKGTDIYVINQDGANLQAITDNFGIHAWSPRWFDPGLEVSSIGLKTTTWGAIKQKYRENLP